MARGVAKRTIDISDFRFKMKGIECDATVDRLDEAPPRAKIRSAFPARGTAEGFEGNHKQ